jgi:O-antigen/teichoic acid export membrane protein
MSREAINKPLAFALRAVRSPVAIYLGASVACRGVSFFLIPLYTHKLSLAEYGDFALAQSAIGLLPMALTLGLLSAVPRAFFKEVDRAEGMRQAGDVAAWMTVIGFATAAIAEVIVLALVPPSHGNGLGSFEVTCVLVASIGAALTSVPSTLFRAAQRPLAAAFFQALEAISTAGLGVYFVALRGLGLRGALLALACAYGITGLCSFVMIFGFLKGRPRRAGLGGLLRFSLPFVPHFAANWAQAAGDRWILKGAGQDSTVGAFAVAGQLLSPASMTTAAYHDYASAEMGELFRTDRKEGLRAACRRQRRNYFLSALIPSALCLAAMPVIQAVIGKSFTEAFWTMPLLAVVALIDTQYFPNMNVVYYAERTKLIPRVTIATAVVNVVLSVVLIPRIGLPGAILARLASSGLRLGMFTVFANDVLVPRVAPEQT